MPVRVKSDFAVDPLAIMFLLDFATTADITSSSRTRVEARLDVDGTRVNVVATGTDLRVANEPGNPFPALVDGRVDKVVMRGDGDRIEMTGLGLDIGALRARAEREGDGLAAIAKTMMRKDFVLSTSGDAEYGLSDVLEFGFGLEGVTFNLRGDDKLRLRGGDDLYDLGFGNDVGWGGKGNDELYGNRGRDSLFGGDGADSLFGGGGNDLLTGGKGRDLINGGGKSDVITGGKGKDDLSGGRGADTFVFKTGDGADIIQDFRAQNDAEDIDLSGVKAITSFSDLKNNHMVAEGNDVIIRDGAGLEITVAGVDINDMNSADFLF